jgi:hypothetical protein
MNYPYEITAYWGEQLLHFRWLGFLCQFLGLFVFIALWWHQDRAWRILRWVLGAYFLVIGIMRFDIWLLYGLVSNAPDPVLRAFMIRSGIAGDVLCTLSIVFLFLDSRRRWVGFADFSPEAWNARKPSATQWIGLLIAFLGLSWPFVPSPEYPGDAIFRFGYVVSFGMTLTPTFIFLGGLCLAGMRRPRMSAIAFLAAATSASALAIDPIMLQGILAVLLSVLLVLASIRLSPEPRRAD